MIYLEYYLLGIILLPAIILAIYAEIKVSINYKKYSEIYSQSNLTGKEVAEKILKANNINNVKITEVSGTLTDYYDSKNKVLAISSKNYNSSSIASLGVTAHECGHAIQDNTNYFPLKLRQVIIKSYSLTSKLLVPLLILGLLFSLFLLIPVVGEIFIYIALITFGLSLLLNLITLPVEFNASKRALKILKEENILTKEESKCVKKVLNSAALTYVAAFLYSLLNFLRILIIFGRRND